MNVLHKALEIIHERGMCKNEQQDWGGRVCVYGALCIAEHGAVYTDYDLNASSVLDRTAKELFPERWEDASWASAATVNNHHDTTQEDVELILKHAAYEYDLLYGEQQ